MPRSRGKTEIPSEDAANWPSFVPMLEVEREIHDVGAKRKRRRIGAAPLHDGSQLKREEKRSSKVWLFFSGDERSSGVSVCNSCGAEISCIDGSTSNLRRHLKSKHNDLFEDMLRNEAPQNACKADRDTYEDMLKNEAAPNARKAVKCKRRRIGADPLDDGSQPKREEKRSSKVWLFFSGDESSSGVSVCNSCGAEISCIDGSTSNLRRHLKAKHNDLFEDMLQNEAPQNACKADTDTYEDMLQNEAAPNAHKAVKRKKMRIGADPLDDGSQPKREEKRSSKVWLFFSSDGKTSGVSICNSCGTEISCIDGSTSNLRRHLKAKHNDLFEDMLRNEAPQNAFKAGRDTFEDMLQTEAAQNACKAVKCKEWRIGADPLDDGSQPKREEKRSSKVWLFFSGGEKSSGVSICNSCSAEISCIDGSTSNLRRHLKAKHNELFEDMLRNESPQNACKAGSDICEDMLQDEAVPNACKAVDDLYEDLLQDGATQRACKSVNAVALPLLKEIAAFCQTEAFWDVEVVCGVDGGTVRSHRIVLSALSPVLYAAIRGCSEWLDVVLLLPDVSSVDLIDLLRSVCLGTAEKAVISDELEYLRFGCRYAPLVFKIKEKPSQPLNRARQKIEKPRDGKRSPVWKHFVEMDKRQAMCNVCGTTVRMSCGSTTNLARHLKTKHANEYQAMQEEAAKSEESDQDDDGHEKKETRGRVKTSLIWKYFAAGKGKATCVECGQRIAVYDSSTSALQRHLRRVHEGLFEEFRATTQPAGQRKAEAKPNGGGGGKVSNVWRFYDEDGEKTAKCKICHVSLRFFKAAATSGLIRHLKRHHGEEYKALKQDRDLQKTAGVLSDPSHPIWARFKMKDSRGEEATCSECMVDLEVDDLLVMAMVDHLKLEHPATSELYEVELNTYRVPVVSAKAANNARGSAWEHFTKSDDPLAPSCAICSTPVRIVSRLRSLNLARHLKQHHGLDCGLKEGKQQRRKGGRRSAADDPAEKTCPTCKKAFSCRAAMRYHLRVVHSGIRPYKCEVCGMTFARLDSFRGHTHDTVTRSFLCSLCGKTFGRRSVRDVHEKAHRAERRFQCSHCSKWFLTNQQLRNHERTHTGEKPHQCSDCGRQFAQRHQLKTHFRIHTGEKPYSCDRCDQRFRHLSSKRNHKCGPTFPAKEDDDDSSVEEETEDVGRATVTWISD